MLIKGFEEQVKKNPEKVIVKTERNELTYKALNQYANQIAYNILDKCDTTFKLSDRERTRYRRQLLIDGWDIEGQEKLKASTVFVAGAGGSGSPLIMQLALCGVGNIIVCDFDEVDLSNLNRQCLHDESRIGINKAVSAKMSIEKLNPNVNIIVKSERITRDNVFELVGDSAIIFDNVDHLETKFILSECAVEKQIPHMISSMIDINSYVAIFHSPHTPCFHCLYDREKLKEIEEINKFRLNYKKIPNSVASPSLFLSTGFACNEALKILLGFENPAYNKYFLFNQRGSKDIVNTKGHLTITYPFSEHFRKTSEEQGFDWNEGWRGNFMEELEIRHNPDCPLCGGKAKKAAAPTNTTATAVHKPHTQEADQKVALLFEHGTDMIAGIIGALKADKIYVPFDPTYPEQRLAYMLEDSEASLIVTNTKNLPLAQRLTAQANGYIKILNIDTIDQSLIYENIERKEEGDKIAYILYTSGSTGKPKGVVQTHENVRHFIESYTKDMQITEADRLTLFSAFSHDAAVIDIYSGLLKGATLYPLNVREQINIGELAKWLTDNGITIWHSVPTLYRYFASVLTEKEAFEGLRLIVLGGESVREHDVTLFKTFFPQSTLVNLYGQSESSYNSAQFIRQDTDFEGIHLGLPTQETQLLIMNDRGRQLGFLKVGEIVVVGKHIAKGYWKDREKTEKVFTSDPELGLLYHTGDQGRRLEDGSIEYMGRKDFQIKIRGFRVETEEIEGKLLIQEAIKEAVVVAKEDETKDLFLCAYITADREMNTQELREALSKEVPDYMMPTHFVQLDKIPMTPNGKVDRKALPEPKGAINTGVEYVAPRNETEEKLVSLWQEVLGIEKIGVKDNFFELGGHSLKATNLAAKIHKAFHVAVPLKEIFQTPTIEGLAVYMEGAKESRYTAIAPIESKPYYALSSAQKRLYALNQFDENSLSYNMSFAMAVEGQLEQDKLEKAFAELIQRHESLRTAFEMQEGEAVQKVYETVDFKIDYAEYPKLEEEALKGEMQKFVRPFDLSKAPLLRVKVIKEQEEKYILMVDMHHIISDGTSMTILIQEFAALYQGLKPAEMKLQYKDFAAWQNRLFASEQIAKQEAYWVSRFKEAPTPLQMPLDFKRPEKMTFDGQTIPFEIGAKTVEKLNKLAKDKNITPNMLMISLYNVLLSHFGEQQDIVTGSLSAGRSHPDLQNIMGMFANFLPIRSKVTQGQSFSKYLAEMKQILTEAYDNQDYPFDKILAKANIKTDRSRNPLFDTMLIFHNEIDPNTKWEIPGLKFTGINMRNETATLDFKTDIYMGDGGELKGYLQYNTNLFKQETMQKFIESYQKLTEILLDNPEQPIDSIALFDEAEKQQMAEKRRLNAKQPAEVIKLAVSATFTAEPVKDYIKWWAKQAGQEAAVEFASYNQVFQELLTPDSLISTNDGANLLMVRFEDWIRGDQSKDTEQCKKLEMNFAELVQILKSKQRQIPYFIALFPISTHLGLSDTVTNYLDILSMRWRETLAGLENVHVIDFMDLAERYAVLDIFDPLKDKTGHLPFSDAYYAAMGSAIAKSLYIWKKAHTEEGAHEDYEARLLQFESYKGEELLKLPIHEIYEENISRAVYTAPATETEKQLAEIWEQILGVSNIGIEDDFFKLGGDSLKATILVSRIYKSLYVELLLKDVFATSKLKEMAAHIEGLEIKAYVEIKPAEARPYYGLSSAQKRLFMLQQFEKDSISYNMPGVIEIEGKLDADRVEKAFKTLAERHEILRTSFELIEGEPIQIIHENIEFRVNRLEKESHEVPKMVKQFVAPFDLSKAPLLRTALIKCSEEKHVLIYDMHHIISDGTSMGILVREFVDLYEGKELKPLSIQYKDYAVWQNEWFATNGIQKQEKYWMEKLAGEIPVLNLPTDYQRPALQSFDGDSISFKIGREQTRKIKETAEQTGSTLYMLCLAAYNVLLSKYSGQEDIIVGSPIAGRPHEDLQPIIGMFVNTLAMRNFPEGGKTFAEFLEEVKENALKAYENQDYPFEELVDKLSLQRDMSRNPLFDVMFSMQNMDLSSRAIQGLRFTPNKFANPIAKFDLTLTAEENGDGLVFSLEYGTKLFKRETAEKIGRHFLNILAEAVRNPQIQLSEINMLEDAERDIILYKFNDTAAEYGRHKALHRLFEEQVQKTPDATALVFDEAAYTYRALNEKANALAGKLREKGVERGRIAAILTERSIETITAILAVLKAGGAYLPIDPEYPADRIAYVLQDSGASILLTYPEFAEKTEFDGDILLLTETGLYEGSTENLQVENTPDDLVYVIYTSGSTGNPKGVMVEHRSIFNQIIGLKERCGFDDTLNHALLYKMTFDVSVQQIFVSLTSGAKLFVPSEEIRNDMRQFWQFVRDNEINIIDTVPSFAEALIESRDAKEMPTFKYFVLGADVFSKNLYDRLKESFSIGQIINAYGPTETTINATLHLCQEAETGKTLPIGRPLPNYNAYILDKHNNLLPIGVPGELCISGVGVARGYLKRPDLNSERFINNPYAEGQKLYKTGDLAMWLPDGNIEFLGRIDNQVKIRGFRIELGEIEAQLLRHTAVKEAVVIDLTDQRGGKCLSAYVVAKEETSSVVLKEQSSTVLKEHLAKYLPDYMIPTYITLLQAMPLTQSGKIDRKALPKPEAAVEGTEYIQPRNQTEEKLASIFEEVLNIEKAGIHDNFFELGGHSLKAIILASKIHKALNIEVPLKEIFKAPTIAGLAEYVESGENAAYLSIEPAEQREYYPVSGAERRLFTLNQFESQSIGYNMPGAVRIQGQLDLEKLEETFKQLIKRHETLRTSFDMIDENIVQKVHESVDFKVEYAKIQEEQTAAEAQAFIRPFDLGKAPLLRVKVISTAKDRHILLFDMHHIISDGVSMDLLIKEFAYIYEGKALPPLRIQYKDYSLWQNNQVESGAMKEHETYWLNCFAEEIPVLNLPADYTRPSIQQFEGDRVRFELDGQCTQKLSQIAAEKGATLYMALLAAYIVLLSKYSGQEDIIVGSPIAGRNHADLEHVIGMFVNTLALRNYPQGDKTFTEFLEDVRENTLKAFQHQQYQFEELVDKLEITRDMSRNPLFDTVFVMQNGDTAEPIRLKDITFLPYELERNVSKFDLTLTAAEYEGKLVMDMEYSTKLFKRETIQKMVDHFVHIVQAITSQKDIKLKEINMLSEDEVKYILSSLDNREVGYPKDKTIHRMFEEQTARVPDHIALVCEEEKLTYRELNQKANQIARLLREKGVKPDTIVGILVERSLETVIGILAILKAGGAYLPIDPEYPTDRIQYTLLDSKTNILLTQRHLTEQIEFGGEAVYLDEEALYQGDGANLAPLNTPKDMAYIIYTSGSTGKPKGVIIEHEHVVRLMQNDQMLFDFTENDTWTMFHSMCFDFSVWEMYGALLFGGKLVMVKKHVAQSPKAYLELLKQEKVTVLNQTPTAFYNLIWEEMQFADKALNIRYIIFGGEALKPGMLKDWKEKYPKTKLINMYGITETTVHVTYKEITDHEIKTNISNIGKPIPTLSAYIMDKNMKLQPIGVPGELCVGGVGVARGYLNRIELTNEKFIQNPYRQEERLYRSGDLARLLPSGEMEYLGRIDHQVKIRGHRIELGEIENQLLKHETIKEAIVLHKTEAGEEAYLCAYITADRTLTSAELREHLSKTLPLYMIPSYFVQLDKIPLTSNGKVDRKALPRPKGIIDTGTEYIAPANETQEKLASLWAEVLGIEKPGIKDNFFELGGHSLKATSLTAKIHKTFHVEIPLKEVFGAPTIEAMAKYIQSAEESRFAAIEPIEAMAYYPLSSAQKRLFVLHQFNESSTGYNMSFAMDIEGTVNQERLENAFHALIARHEALRTSFEMKEGEAVQIIHETVPFTIDYTEAHEMSEEALKAELENFVQPFDLSKAPLLRVKLLKQQQGQYILMTDMHHIISDGMSMNTMIQEFAELYQGKELSAMKLQYKDFAAWQNRLFASFAMAKQEAYWADTFKEAVTPICMPLDFKRPEKLTFEGRTIPFEIEAKTVEKLNRRAKDKNITLNMMMLALYNIQLSKYSGQEDIITGSLTAGRRHPDLQNIMGMFANFLPIRSKVRGDRSFTEYLDEVKQTLTEVYDHQDYPFDKIIEKANAKADRSRNPLFDTMLVFHNEIDLNTSWEIPGLKFTGRSLKNETATLDFKVDIYMGSSGELRGYLQYNTNLFKEETMQTFIRHFNALTTQLTDCPEKALGEVEIFEAEEKQQILQKRKQNTNPATEATKLAVSATFTAEPIKEYIEWWCKQLGQGIEVEFAAYNQVFQELLTPQSLISTNTGANLLLVRFEDWIRGDSTKDSDKCKKLERNFAEFIQVLKNKQREIPYFIGVFPLSTHLGFSDAVINYMEILTIRWKDALKDLENVHLIDFTDLGERYSIRDIFDPLKDKAGHLPFTDEYYGAMGTAIARSISAWKKQHFKVIVVDCDNTLWKGICGEDGTLGVKVEEPYKILQTLLLQKYNEGMLLAICSKNNESDVWEVFDKNPGMLLKKEHFVDWRINWQPKSENLKEMAKSLNLGVDSFLFIDDSPMECSEMMTNCPQVLTLQLPKDSAQIPHYLRHVWAFDRFQITEEDRKRTQMYMQERKRQESQNENISLQDFLQGLKLKMSMNIMEKSQLPRVAQLTQRTNQFNLSTIRRTEAELEALIADPRVQCRVIEVSDRFGDYGLVGVVITREEGEKLFIDTLLLSCRVLARGVENAILTGLKKHCLKQNLTGIEADYYPTAKNKPIAEFLQKSKWSKLEEKEVFTRYTLSLEDISDAIDYMECYYDASYTKDEPQAAAAKVQTLQVDALDYVAITAENDQYQGNYDWQVEVINEENLLHKGQLLPLKNHTGQALLGLPIHEAQESQAERAIYIAPNSDIEKKLAEIWSQVLGIQKIGIQDNFFKLGGDSLKAIVMISKVYKEFRIELPLKDVFEQPTIKAAAQCISDMQSTGENSNKGIEQSRILLNEKKDKNVFLFPPIIGYGISYKYLSNLIDYCSVYALNFIEDENAMEYYIRLITEVQKDGPYILLGYSAGGALAFEVAKEMEKRGYTVSDVILLDSYKKEQVVNLSKENVEMSVKAMIAALKAGAEGLNSDVVLDNINDTVVAYETYINRVVNSGTIKGDIHLVKAADNYVIPGIEDTRGGWGQSTGGSFIVYEGFGNHFEMIDPGNAEKNERILREIIDGEDGR